jgi:hypothetical protein
MQRMLRREYQLDVFIFCCKPSGWQFATQAKAQRMPAWQIWPLKDINSQQPTDLLEVV